MYCALAIVAPKVICHVLSGHTGLHSVPGYAQEVFIVVAGGTFVGRLTDLDRYHARMISTPPSAIPATYWRDI